MPINPFVLTTAVQGIKNIIDPEKREETVTKIETVPKTVTDWGKDVAETATDIVEVPKNVILSGVEGLQTLGTAGLDGLKKYLPIIAIGALALFAAKR